MNPDTFKTQILIISAVLALVAVLVRYIRQNRLREEYVLIWGFSALAMLYFAFHRAALHHLAKALGVQYAPALLLIVGGLACMAFVVHISVVVSGFQRKIKDMAHEIAFLKQKLEENAHGQDPHNQP